MAAVTGHRLAGRVSGDSTVAYAWAYAQALEAITDVPVPPRALWLRALALERERIANHLGDLGYLGNDGGFAFGLAQFSRLKELVLRTNFALFGHRLAMDYVAPGGVSARPRAESATTIRDECDMLEREVRVLRDIYDEHDGLQDRFRGCGIVTPALAAQLGLTGLAGRASGQARDVRCDFAAAPYDALDVRKVTAEGGDVVARVAVRFDEIMESLRLVRAIVDALPKARIATVLPEPPPFRKSLGYVEGWRGPSPRSARVRARRHHPPLPSARPVVDELACARARGDRQHRSRLPADQQVVQSFLQRTGPLGLPMLHILRQIAKTGIKTERPPFARPRHGRRRAPAEGDRQDVGTRIDDPPGRRRILQRLRARNPRARQSVLQHRRPRHQVRREPAARRPAAGDRPGVEAHGDRAATHL
jgi:hypothetical protein